MNARSGCRRLSVCARERSSSRLSAGVSSTYSGIDSSVAHAFARRDFHVTVAVAGFERVDQQVREQLTELVRITLDRGEIRRHGDIDSHVAARRLALG